MEKRMKSKKPGLCAVRRPAKVCARGSLYLVLAGAVSALSLPASRVWAAPNDILVDNMGEKVGDIRVEGNRAVQSDAVRGLMNTRTGQALNAQKLRNDIKAIYRSGFFQDVQVETRQEGGKLVLVVKVIEKPSIREIKFSGFNVVSASSLADKLQVKRYTILDERKINSDLRLIEQTYTEKGFYLARASYALQTTESGEVQLTYSVIENNAVSVARVNLLGNVHFSDMELKNGMATREKRWTSWFTNSGTFKDEFINRDKEFLAYLYRDTGFAEATTGSPQARLETGRQNVEVSYFIEEGERFRLGNVKVSGDVIFPESTFQEKLALQKGNWFRISQFQNDIRTLTDLYGDEGYAFVDVVPKTSANRDTRIIDIEFTITKGQKVYFRNIVVEGNAKTRDNVIRRNIKVTEGDRFHSTNLDKSKAAIERLGFFQEVQLQREPDQKNLAMDLRVKVKEKSTGTLSASIGASPSQNGKSFNFFAQGQYGEANLIGKGWSAGLSANLTPTGSYGFNASLTEPSINDGPWSVTLDGSYKYTVDKLFEWEGDRFTHTRRAGVTLGREIIEDMRFSVGYSYERVSTNSILPYLRHFTEEGDTERLTNGLTYDRTDNFLEPSSGYFLSASNTLGVHLIGGHHQFGRTEAQVAVYVPLVFFDDFKTNFRFSIEPAYVYPIGRNPVPTWERLRLGSMLNMKAYLEPNVISPKVEVIESPGASDVREVARGGNRRIYGSAEYFFPLIPEAKLRLVTFAESGAVLDEGQAFKSDLLKYDVGFGFRWATPIAPFRFEWAWPVEKGKLGESQFIFFVGNDNATSLGF